MDMEASLEHVPSHMPPHMRWHPESSFWAELSTSTSLATGPPEAPAGAPSEPLPDHLAEAD